MRAALLIAALLFSAAAPAQEELPPRATLVWAQPYPPPGTPPSDGVRCYLQVGQSGWWLWQTTTNDGRCRPVDLLDLREGTLARFHIRGFNAAGESAPSNVLEVLWPRVCYAELVLGPPGTPRRTHHAPVYYYDAPCPGLWGQTCKEIDRTALDQCVVVGPGTPDGETM